ncbi:MAG: iron transporter substrate-binding protein [Alphaproteobacteria bacterium]|nr:iron transporter substrate-binding protein [Alphaproteobacteria bacterium]
MSRFLALGALLWMAALHADSLAQDFPRSRGEVVEAARQEGELVIYSVLHADAAVTDLLDTFHRRYPFIKVRNSDDDGALTYRRFRREVAAGRPSADFIWSSAMDLQEKLINDGFSLSYASPEMPSLPAWAHWQDLGYGVTLEPIAMVYNRRFLKAGEMPRTHAGLRDLLNSDTHRFQGRVAVYNPEKSEVGMLLLSQDVRVTRDSWNLFDSFGAVDAQLYSTSRDMLQHILNGDHWIGYDVIASYAEEMHKAHPELVVVYPSDYVLLLSRVAFVTAAATHPNAGKLFLDFLLSKEGQTVLKRHGMGPVRNDMDMPEQQSRLDPVRTQAIRIGPGLLSGLDSLVRAQFLRRWQSARS